MAANFLLVPAAVWVLARLLPNHAAIRLGVFMVLLVPCTDWFNSFTYLGRGDARLSLGITPLLLLVQFALLPGYLLVFLGEGFADAVRVDSFLLAFGTLIALPLALAAATEYIAARNRPAAGWLARTALLPVPLLALTVFLISASQVNAVADAGTSVARAGAVFLLYLVIAAPLAQVLMIIFGLSVMEGRTLAFSLGTRNSFVVLPMALALPIEKQLAVPVIVLQSLIELTGMLVYLWLVPGKLFPDRGEFTAWWMRRSRS